MLVDAGGDREDVGIEDDVLGRKALGDEQFVGARADLDLALLGVGLAGLVERHDYDRGAVIPDQPRMGQELLLALLHADRIDDRLARHAFEPGLDHAPFRRIDHDRHAGDVGLGGDQLEEGDHRRLGVEQALVHVDVDDLGAVLDLAARDLDRGGIIVGHDQLLEFRRSGDVGALADIDEGGDATSLPLEGEDREGCPSASSEAEDPPRHSPLGRGTCVMCQAARTIGSMPASRVRRSTCGMTRGA